MDRRNALPWRSCLLLLACCFGCASTPSPLTIETNASEAISAARHVAYWMDVDCSNVRSPDPVLQEEIGRLRAAGARLSASAEALEQELEAATIARVEGRSSTFAERGPMQTRVLREQTIQARTQWEAFLRRLDEMDAMERPGTAAGTPSAAPSGAGEPPRPGRASW